MPEGPEIHRAANRIAKALVGKTLNQVEFHYNPIFLIMEKLTFLFLIQLMVKE